MRSVISPVFRRTLPWDPVRDKTGAIGSRRMPSFLGSRPFFSFGDSVDRFDDSCEVNQERHETRPLCSNGRNVGTQGRFPFRPVLLSPSRSSCWCRFGVFDLVCDLCVSLHSRKYGVRLRSRSPRAIDDYSPKRSHAKHAHTRDRD